MRSMVVLLFVVWVVFMRNQYTKNTPSARTYSTQVKRVFNPFRVVLKMENKSIIISAWASWFRVHISFAILYSSVCCVRKKNTTSHIQHSCNSGNKKWNKNHSQKSIFTRNVRSKQKSNTNASSRSFDGWSILSQKS